MLLLDTGGELLVNWSHDPMNVEYPLSIEWCDDGEVTLMLVKLSASEPKQNVLEYEFK